MKKRAKFRIFLIIAIILLLFPISTSALESLKVSQNGHYLETESGTPFFWIGDTGWQTIVDLTRENVDFYFDNRKAKGFTIIQMYVVGWEAPNPNVYGQKAFKVVNSKYDATQPIVNTGSNNDFWDHVDYVINAADQRGLYIALLPIWGSSNVAGSGNSRFITNTGDARAYGEFIGNRYKNNNNIIWVLGGDIAAKRGSIDDRPIYRAMADGIVAKDTGGKLITYHPAQEPSRTQHSSSDWFHNDAWLGLNMIQVSGRDMSQLIPLVSSDYSKTPTKPTVHSEGAYEESTKSHSSGQNTPYWMRKQVYWPLLSGAIGQTYGHYVVFKFGSGWKNQLNDNGAKQVPKSKIIFEKYQWWTLVPDQSIITSGEGSILKRKSAAISSNGNFLMVYFSERTSGSIDFDRLSGSGNVKAIWYKTTDASSQSAGTFSQSSSPTSFTPPSGWEDALLVIELEGVVPPPTTPPPSPTPPPPTTPPPTTPPPSPTPPPPTPPPMPSTISSQNLVSLSKCLTSTGTLKQSNVVISECDEMDSKLWTYTNAGELKNNGLCLDVKDAITISKANVQLYTCNGGDNQKWERSGTAWIPRHAPALCLDIQGAISISGANVQVYTCHGDQNQQWETQSPTPSTLPPPNPLKQLDLNNDNKINLQDLLVIIKNFKKAIFDTVADINKDGIVDLFDLVKVARHFGETVSQTTSPTPPPPPPTSTPPPTPPPTTTSVNINSPAQGTTFTSGQSITAKGSGTNLVWGIDRIGDGLGDFASGTGSQITFTVPSDSTASQTIEIKLSGDSGTVKQMHNIVLSTSPPPSPTPSPIPPPSPPTGASTSPNLKVAFIGDTGAGSNFRSVLQLIKNEGADIVMHQGDFAYEGSTTSNWEKAVNDILGSNFPYFGSVGNHDSSWSSSYAPKLKARADRVGISCTGKYGENSVCKYQGLHMILSGGGQKGTESGNGQYITDELAKDNSVWSICSWHHNQREMQVGGKGSAVGWGPYEECRKGGAIIATAHEHSYSRTKTLSNMQSRTVDTSCKDNPNTPQVDVCVGGGSTFVFVSGLGGKSIRDQERCLPTTYPYGCKKEWASIYTSPQQNAKYGALFIDFNVDGNPNKARGYFKNINNKVIDRFEITRR